VSGGISLAVALGVPLGAFIGNRFGWRMNFIGVAGLSVIALAGLRFGLPKGIGAALVTANLRERIAVVRQPPALLALCVTTIWAVGTYSVFTYIALFLATVVGLEGAAIGYVLFLWGAAAFVGLLLGGLANDRIGSRRVIFAALPVMALALMSLTLVAHFLAQSARLAPVLIAVIIWGLTAWGFFPAQQSRLIGITGLKGIPVILSLNASFMYLGFSIGAAVGSFVLTQGNVTDLGWVGGLWVLSSLTLFILSDSRTKQLQPTRTKENK
jgi:predicted MFS family arabinose efflux permease